MKFALVSIILLTFVSGAAQDLTPRQRTQMAGCAFGWIGPKFYKHGIVRFSYLIEPLHSRGPRDVYVVFWNRSRTEGAFLKLNLAKNAKHRDSFWLINNGDVLTDHGKLDISDVFGGIYTFDHIRRMLPRLKRRRATVLHTAALPTTDTGCQEHEEAFELL